MSGRIRRRVLPSGVVRYYVLIRIDGRERSFGGFEKKKLAETRLRAVLEQAAAGTLGHPDTFEEFAEKWLEGCAGSVRPRTLTGYEQIVRLHLLPVLGAYGLKDIGPAQVQATVSRASAAGLAPLTVQKVLTVLRMVLNRAEVWGYIQSNPARHIHPPASQQREMDFLTPDELVKLLDNAGRSLPIIATAAATGLRQGELFALRRMDMDLEKQRITVRRSYHPAQGFTSPKSKAGKRAVPICDELAVILAVHLKGIEERDTLVFPAPKGGPQDPFNFVRVDFLPALERAGLRRIRFHDLRHTYATIMLSLGANVKALQVWMGHASIRTTLDLYGHLLDTDDDGVQERMTGILRTRQSRRESEEGDGK